MPLFLWKKSYEVNIPEIDAQHRRLVEVINKLSDAMMLKQGYKIMPHILEELSAYVQLHFAAEEKIMREMNYPELEDHCQMHNELAQRVLDFRTAYTNDQSLDTKALLDFLCQWLKDHISVNDKAIGRFLRRLELGLE
jgi:hemerythrin